MPSLPVNCCAESGPCTTSLSICFRSLAYRRAHSRGTVGRAVGLRCQAPFSPPRKRQLDRRLAPGLAPWLARLLAGVGLRHSLDASPGGMLAATGTAGLAQQPLLAFQETSAPEVPTSTTIFSPSKNSSLTLKKKLTRFENQFAFPCVASSPVLFLCFPFKSRALCSRAALNYDFLQYLVGWSSTLIPAMKTRQAKGVNAGCEMASPFADGFPVRIREQGPDLHWSRASPHQLSAQPRNIKCFCSTPSHHHNCQLRPHHRIFISGDNRKEQKYQLLA